MKTIYALTQPGDCEGRSVHTVGYFEDKEVALAIGRTGHGNESMGPSEGYVSSIKVFESANDFYAMNEGADPAKYKGPGHIDVQDQLRVRGLAKLTAAERRALGI